MTGSVGWGFDQPGLVEGVSAHGTGVGTRWSLNVPSNPNTLWFHNSMILIGIDHVIQIMSMIPLEAGITPEDFSYTAPGIARNCQDHCQVPLKFFGIWLFRTLRI